MSILKEIELDKSKSYYIKSKEDFNVLKLNSNFEFDFNDFPASVEFDREEWGFTDEPYDLKLSDVIANFKKERGFKVGDRVWYVDDSVLCSGFVRRVVFNGSMLELEPPSVNALAGKCSASSHFFHTPEDLLKHFEEQIKRLNYETN